MNTDRQAMIDLLVIFTNKAEKFFEGMTDERLFEEYERLMKRD